MKKIQKILVATMALAMLVTGCSSNTPAEGNKPSGAADKYPARDINMTVPFNAGGSTDLTGRVVGEAMGRNLGVNFVVTNTPGAGGSVGTQSVLTAKLDGYTMLVDGMLAFTSMPVMDTLKTMPDDWDMWMATFTPNVIAVKGDSPYETLEDLIADMQARPGEVTAGTAGAGSAGRIAAELLVGAAGVEYKHVPYDGGNAAIVAALAGEVDFVPQLLVEMKDMLVSGDMRALAVFTEQDLTLENGTVIPSITTVLPDLAAKLPMGETTGLLMPKGIDEGILEKLDASFAEAMKDEKFLEFCATKGFDVTAMTREESAAYVNNLQSVVAWTLFDAGVAKVSPEEFDIARP